MDLKSTRHKSRKIRIYPNQKQKQLFKQWFGISRLFYNKGIDNYNKPKEERIVNWMDLTKDLLETLTENYTKSVPYQIKKIAVKDSFESWKINCRKTKATGKPFSMSFKSRKNPTQSCYIPKSAIKETGIYYTIAGKLSYAEMDWFDKDISDARLVCENRRWFICFSYEVSMANIKNENQVFDIVAIDPGIRSFITYFSINGHFGQIGNRAFEKLQMIALQCDKLYSKLILEKDKHKKCSLKRVINRLKWRIKDLVDELHWKTIKFLADNFKVIYYPSFDTGQMVTKLHRRLRSKTVRNMLSFRFYQFKQRLIEKCKNIGVKLVICNESYTSKINSFTGETMKIGGRESFIHNGIIVDRDINGARNILIRNIYDNVRDSSALG